ncbi:MAG: hypothetical protein V3V33_02265 [Candidatus Lokiarchaeia archaeon]
MKAKKAVKTKLAKKQNIKNLKINPLKINTTGTVKIIEIITRTVPLLSRLKKSDKINNTNVNPAKKAIKNAIIKLKVRFEMTKILKMNKNQEIMKRITIIIKIVFFDRFFNPEINLMIIAFSKISFI